jgi:hypothetical protein
MSKLRDRVEAEKILDAIDRGMGTGANIVQGLVRAIKRKWVNPTILLYLEGLPQSEVEAVYDELAIALREKTPPEILTLEIDTSLAGAQFPNGLCRTFDVFATGIATEVEEALSGTSDNFGISGIKTAFQIIHFWSGLTPEQVEETLRKWNIKPPSLRQVKHLFTYLVSERAVGILPMCDFGRTALVLTEGGFKMRNVMIRCGANNNPLDNTVNFVPLIEGSRFSDAHSFIGVLGE